MAEKLQRFFNVTLITLLVFQLTGCGTLLYPERRNQLGGRLDVGVVILDAVGLLFFIIPGVIAFAVDLSTGCIYLPAPRPLAVGHVVLRQIKFDPKHITIAKLEKIIKDQTGYSVKLTQENVRVSRLKSKQDMMEHFAQAQLYLQDTRLAFNR